MRWKDLTRVVLVTVALAMTVGASTASAHNRGCHKGPHDQRYAAAVIGDAPSYY